jgi:hypothetical protein
MTASTSTWSPRAVLRDAATLCCLCTCASVPWFSSPRHAAVVLHLCGQAWWPATPRRTRSSWTTSQRRCTRPARRSRVRRRFFRCALLCLGCCHVSPPRSARTHSLSPVAAFSAVDIASWSGTQSTFAVTLLAVIECARLSDIAQCCGISPRSPPPLLTK